MLTPKQSRQPTWIGNPYGPLLESTRYESAQSAGKFFLLFHKDFKDFNDANIREWYDWAQLRSLSNAAAVLTDVEINRLRYALEDARGADWSIRIDISEVANYAHDAGIVAGKVTPPDYQISSVFLPFDMPYTQAAPLAGTRKVRFYE